MLEIFLKAAKEAIEFDNHFHLHGIPNRYLNKEFTYNGNIYELKGYNRRAKRYPIIYLKNGESYKCSIKCIQNILKDVFPQLFI